jgi:hypothetical protein
MRSWGFSLVGPFDLTECLRFNADHSRNGRDRSGCRPWLPLSKGWLGVGLWAAIHTDNPGPESGAAGSPCWYVAQSGLGEPGVQVLPVVADGHSWGGSLVFDAAFA